MNILVLFSQPWNVGGAETHVTDLVKSLSARGHQVFMAVHGDHKAIKLEPFLKQQWLFNFRSANPLSYVALGENLSKLVKEHKIDIIHAHQRTSGYIAAYIRWKTKIPFVVTIHDPWKRAPLKKLHSKVFQDIITVSEFLKKHFIATFGFAADKVHTVYNGVDEQRYDPAGYSHDLLKNMRAQIGILPEDKVISLIARIYASKGHQYLIGAAPVIITKMPNVKFLFVGIGEHEERFRVLIKEKGLEQYFIFAGYREDIPEIIAISDIVVRPSDMEGLPINLIEAMLMEKPVIATAIAGVPEMIRQGENGYMMNPGDEKALAQYSIDILSDEAAACIMGQKGRKISLEKFTLTSLVNKVEFVYQTVLSGQR